MSDFITIVAVFAVIGFVIGRQLIGEPLRGKRVVMLPVVLTVIGLTDLGGSHHQPVTPTDIACLVVGGLLVTGIGLAQGCVTRLESRDGALWGQMPVKGLWLWALLIATRLAMTGVAVMLGAHVAASSSTILLMLGINRLAQAAVVVPRAMSAQISFAPEKDGKVFLANLSGDGQRRSSAQPTTDGRAYSSDSVRHAPSAKTATGIDWTAVGHQASNVHGEPRRQAPHRRA